MCCINLKLQIMRKTLLLLLIVVSIVSCKSKSATNTKLDNKTERSIKGEWTITSVSYPGSEFIKISSFDLVDSKCFIGSNWKFISNNNKGNMALSNSTCASYSSAITWYVNKDGNVVLKFLNENKAKKVLDGYILKVSNVTENSFQFIDKVNVGGKLIDVVYEFQRK